MLLSDLKDLVIPALLCLGLLALVYWRGRYDERVRRWKRNTAHRNPIIKRI